MKGTPPGRRQYSSRWAEEEQTGEGRGSVFLGDAHRVGRCRRDQDLRRIGQPPGSLLGEWGVIYKLTICSTWNIVLAMLYVLYYRYIVVK